MPGILAHLNALEYLATQSRVPERKPVLRESKEQAEPLPMLHPRDAQDKVMTEAQVGQLADAVNGLRAAAVKVKSVLETTCLVNEQASAIPSPAGFRDLAQMPETFSRIYLPLLSVLIGGADELDAGIREAQAQGGPAQGGAVSLAQCDERLARIGQAIKDLLRERSVDMQQSKERRPHEFLGESQRLKELMAAYVRAGDALKPNAPQSVPCAEDAQVVEMQMQMRRASAAQVARAALADRELDQSS